MFSTSIIKSITNIRCYIFTFQLLKQCDIGLEDGLQVSMEYGSITQLKLQLPWTKLGSGGLKISADSLSFVFSVCLKDHDDNVNDGKQDTNALEKKLVSSILLSVKISYFLILFNLIILICIKLLISYDLVKRR